MSEIAVRVQRLGKRYSIGLRTGSYKTLRDSLQSAFSSRLRKLTGSSRAAPARRETIWALRDLSFEVRTGEVLGIIGRNGAGKSTLLKIVSAITEPSEGRVEIYGRVGSLLEVGTGFHPELTGRDNIFLNGAILGMRRREIQRKFDDIVEFAEIAKFIDTPVKHYSSGMYMRLAFAVAAHLDPEILLLDEVLAVGDAGFQRKCLGKMGEVARLGRTVLFVSHNMNAIEQLCTAVLWLRPGESPRLSTDVRGIVCDYLFDQESDVLAATEWNNPGVEHANPWFKPLRFLICDAAGQPAEMPARNDADLWVQIEGEIEHVDPALSLGYRLLTESGLLLYHSFHTDRPDASLERLDIGRCVLRGRIPARFLNEGRYRIDLLARLHEREWLVDPGRSPSIHLTIQGGLSESAFWIGKRPGLLAPVLDWRAVESARNEPVGRLR